MNTQLEMFYNTTNLTGQDLLQHEFRTGTQNELVLKCFRERPGQLLTPFMVCNILHNRYKIWVVRARITTLTKLGYLEKTTTKIMEQEGEDNYCWRLRTC